MGVIISSAAAYFVEMLLLWYYLKKDYTMKFNVFKLMIAPLFLFFVIIGIEPIVNENFTTWIHLGYGLICGALLWFSYRNELKLIRFPKGI